ncbi:hypothetical protein EUTSA_v10015406mg [Eutrema salsugineum]|uniref:Uncharacterized protein n=1 Tax=Eutrema salsugineum TaxID=72664 RepID=V4LL29_EUTSA|nr:O-acyltransferase WSD1 [Eutrema salsugineum]ESQ43167.1 hypothetical protein EUTSA_v10015406mg [Eutrema salsugineum]
MWKEEEEEEPLSPMARVFQSPGIDNCIVITIGFKAKINVEVILDDLKHNVSKHPRFSSKLSDNGARWIKTKVNVEDHVFAPNVDLEEIGEDGDDFVDDYISRLTVVPLDRSRPLWDIHILNVKTSDAEAVTVIRSHHSLGDGMSLMSLLLASTRKTSNLEEFPTMTTSSKRRKMVFHGLILTIFYASKMIWNTIADFFLLFVTILFLKDTETPLKGGVSIQKRFSHRIISLDDLKLIKNAMDMTINDVLLGVTQAALSGYLNRLYGKQNVENGASTSNRNNLPSKLRFRAGVAVNLRPNIGFKPMADMMAKGSKCRWGNYISFIVFPMSIGLETDALVYISKAKSTMDRKKHSFHSALVYIVTGFVFKTFGAKVGAALFKRPVLHTTASISNIVGPMEEISFHGYPIAYIAPSSYGHSQPLVIHFLSYAKKMVISIGVDPTVIPDPHKLFDEMEESLQAMKASLGLLDDVSH